MKEYVLRNKSFKDILKKKIQQTSLKFIWNHQRPQIAKTILTSKTRKNERLILANFNLYYRDLLF